MLPCLGAKVKGKGGGGGGKDNNVMVVVGEPSGCIRCVTRADRPCGLL